MVKATRLSDRDADAVNSTRSTSCATLVLAMRRVDPVAREVVVDQALCWTQARRKMRAYGDVMTKVALEKDPGKLKAAEEMASGADESAETDRGQTFAILFSLQTRFCVIMYLLISLCR